MMEELDRLNLKGIIVIIISLEDLARLPIHRTMATSLGIDRQAASHMSSLTVFVSNLRA
jgi:hypothetical protein